MGRPVKSSVGAFIKHGPVGTSAVLFDDKLTTTMQTAKQRAARMGVDISQRIVFVVDPKAETVTRGLQVAINARTEQTA